MADAMDCRLATMLKHPSLAENATFWEKLAKINRNDNRAIEQLIKEFVPTEALATSQVVTHAASNMKEVFSLHKKAEKAREKLSKTNQQHFDEFIQVLTEKGPQGLYDQPKKWHYEKLVRGDGQHTIRLDGAYRVLFEIKDGVANILDIAKTGSNVGH